MDDLSIGVQWRFSGTERDKATTERDVKKKKKMSENERKMLETLIELWAKKMSARGNTLKSEGRVKKGW